MFPPRLRLRPLYKTISRTSILALAHVQYSHLVFSSFLLLASCTESHSFRYLQRFSEATSDRRMSRTLFAIPNDGDASFTSVAGAGEIMLFGVRVVVDSMRKSVSMNNLSQYEHPQDGSNSTKEDVLAAGYASADEAVAHNSSRHRERERKRGPINFFDRLLVLDFSEAVYYLKFVFCLFWNW